MRQPEAEVFGATIRRLREERAWTHEQLAERASMDTALVMTQHLVGLRRSGI